MSATAGFFARAMAAALTLAASGGAAASAQAPLDGCASAPILARFEAFGRTGRMPPDLRSWLGDPQAQHVAPWSPFDNVDFVGICWVSAWLIHTSEGSVLIDTLYGPFVETLLDNIEKTGTPLADIRYVLMTHGHFDHAGGAAALKPLLPNATFVMTRTGWDEAAADSAASQGGPRAWRMIAPEKVLADGDAITLGDNRFTVIATPGHTWGTASYTYEVVDRGVVHRAVTIGGLGLNAIEGPAQVEAYIESVDRLRALVGAGGAGIDVHLTTHGFSNDLDEDRKALAQRPAGAPNPMVDPAGLLAQLATLRAGAVKRLAVEKAK